MLVIGPCSIRRQNMTYKEVLQAAQGQMGPCRACPVCNGRACGGTIPGPGAKGSGTVAIRG